MLHRLVQNLKNAPTRLSERGSELRERASRAKSEGSEAIWSFQIDALERTEELLSSAPELPVLSSVTHVAERLVKRGLVAATALPIDDYDSMNTRRVSDAVRQLGRVDLLRVRRYELSHKNRKTALAAVERELERFDKRVED